jgi:hypothetical protein
MRRIRCFQPTLKEEGSQYKPAAVLEVVFQGATAPCEIPQRLKLFQNIRLAPCADVQIMSNNFVRTPEKVEE